MPLKPLVPQRTSFGVSTDDALVRRARAGEASAFGELYERHADRVYRFLRFRLWDAAVASDLTQDVFVSALRNLAGLRRPERFASWLMQIAHHQLLNHWQESGRQPAPLALDNSGEEVRGEAIAHLVDPALVDLADIADAVGRRLDLARMLAEARRLTDEQQLVLGLRFAAGLSVAETAAALGKGEPAVKQLQHRAVMRLRKWLREGGPA